LGGFTKACAKKGWQSKISFEEMIEIMV
jgi:hypothetical protein